MSDTAISRVQVIGEHYGYRMEVFAGVSYQCPALKLYGYETERKLRNAIARMVRKAAERYLAEVQGTERRMT